MRRLFLLLLLISTSWGCLAAERRLYPPELPATCRTIYVIHHGWHTGIAVRAADVAPRLWPEVADFPSAAFIEVGWGDARFYQAEKVSAGMALRAVAFPTASVLHMVGLAVAPSAHYAEESVLAVHISKKGLENLLSYIGESYHRDGEGRAPSLGPGLQENSAFYRATGTYVAWNTCNNWTARALRATGFPITPAYALTAGNLWSQVKQRLPEKHPCGTSGSNS
jgi:uncharacterized protein (TIGR02117 family)